MLKSYLFGVSLIFLSITVCSQNNASLSFKVISNVNSEKLEYAVAHLHDDSDSTISQGVSDKRGRVRLDELPAGDFQLNIHFLGYNVHKSRVHLNSGENVLLGEIKLSPLDYNLNEVGVVANAEAVSHKVDKQVINVSKQLSAEGGTAADALQYSPSVQVDAEGNVSLRGSSNFLLLVDGRPTIMESSVILNTIQAETIDKIEVITNPSAKYTSEGNTGIINIITKDSKPASKSALVNAMIATGEKYSGALQFHSGSKKFNWFVSGSFSHKRKINNDEIFRDNINDSSQYESIISERTVTVEAVTLHSGFDYSVNKSNTLQLDLQAGKWDYGRNISSTYNSSFSQDTIFSTEDFSNHNTFWKPGFVYKFDISDRQNLTIDGQISFINNSLSDLYKEDSAIYSLKNSNDIDRVQTDVRLDYEIDLHEKVKLEAGASYKGLSSQNFILYQKSPDDVNWKVIDSLSNRFDFISQTYSAYTALNTTFLSLETQFGLRLEQNQREYRKLEPDFSIKKLSLFPSLHISKTINNQHNFGFSYSRRVNRPSEWQLYPYIYSGDRFSFRRGNPELMDEFVNSFELSYGLYKDDFSLNVQPYFQSISEKVYSYMLEESNNFIETYINLSNATNAGIDFMFNYKPIKSFKITLGGSSYYESWDGVAVDSVSLTGNTLGANGSLRLTYTLKNSIFQFLAVYYAPSNTPQGDIREFYYFDFIVKQYFIKRRLSATLRTHNTFDSGIMIYTINNTNYRTRGRYVYEGPTVILSLSYKINDFRSKRKRESFKSDFDTGLDH